MKVRPSKRGKGTSAQLLDETYKNTNCRANCKGIFASPKMPRRNPWQCWRSILNIKYPLFPFELTQFPDFIRLL